MGIFPGRGRSPW